MFVSYAQNFEDVMLWRALKGVESGCYIDVGAQDPVSDSVSKAFYDLGWRGVHVEPVPQFAQLLREQRPDEQVFQAALGATPGTAKLYSIKGTGLSTVVAEVAGRHLAENAFVSEELSVPRMTLDMIFETLPHGQDIHWLKIDVEGAERAVIDGWSRSKYRPWVVVIEATRPGSTIENFSDWEDLLTANMYSHVYSDGLNRFYLADERHETLGGSFRYPPNVFDGVSLSGLAHAPWTTLVTNRAIENARDLQSSLDAERLSANNLHGQMRDSIESIRRTHAAELESAQQALASTSAEQSSRERNLRQDLQIAQDESVRWSSLVAMRERSHGEVLSEHFRGFQSSLRSALDRAASLVQQVGEHQRGNLALMQDVARLGAQLASLEGERAHEREAFSIRERELSLSAAQHVSEISALAVDTERLSQALDKSTAQVSQLQQVLVASSAEYEHLVATVRAEHDKLIAEVARLQQALTESESEFEDLTEFARTDSARLTESIAILRTDHEHEVSAVRCIATETDGRLQQSQQQERALNDHLRQQVMAVTYWTSIAAKHEWQLNGMHTSWSWRITSPLRQVGSAAMRFLECARMLVVNTGSLAGRLPTGLLEHAVRWIRRHPLQQRWLLSWLNRMPVLRGRMLEFAAAVPLSSPLQQRLEVPPHRSSLSEPPARSAVREIAPRPASIVDQLPVTSPTLSDAELPRSPLANSEGEFSRALQSWQLGRRVNS